MNELGHLQPLLAHYNAPSAVLRVLESGEAYTVGQLVEITGKFRQRIHQALVALMVDGLVTRTGQVYTLAVTLSLPCHENVTSECHENVTNPSERHENVTEEPKDLSRKRDTDGHENVTIPENRHENVTVTKTLQAENTEQDGKPEERHENVTSSLSFNSLSSLSSLSISLKDKDLKDKEQLKPEPKTKKPRAKKIEEPYEPRLDPRLPSWLPPDLWSDFCDHRDTIRKPLTRLAVSYLLGDLNRWESKHGVAACLEALRRTIRSGKWIDIYEPKPAARASPSASERESWTEDQWLGR